MYLSIENKNLYIGMYLIYYFNQRVFFFFFSGWIRYCDAPSSFSYNYDRIFSFPFLLYPYQKDISIRGMDVLYYMYLTSLIC